MRLTSFAALLICLSACFDFTPTVEADIGGKCGDLDHYCTDGLTCDDGVCVRDEGSGAGEFCDARVLCGAQLTCVEARCVGSCTTLDCGEHGGCAQAEAGPFCTCDEGYELEGDFCSSSRGTPCSTNGNQRCLDGLVCLNGRCAEACGEFYCEGGTICSDTGGTFTCDCPSGQTIEQGLCVGLCQGKSCSERGRCVITDSVAACVCDSGYEPAGVDCVTQGCSSPSSHASTKCDSGHMFWYNSCNAREDMAIDCGARGCDENGCRASEWASRDVTFSGATVRAADFAIGVDDALVAVAATTAGISIRVWQGGWSDFAVNNGEYSAGNGGLTTVSVELDSSNRPNVAFCGAGTGTGIGGPQLFVRWNGSTWEGIGTSHTTGLFQTPTYNCSLALDSEGVPYVASLFATPGSGGVSVSRANGSSWTQLGTSTGLVPPTTAPLAFALLTNANPMNFARASGAARVRLWDGSTWSNPRPDVSATSDRVALAAQSSTSAIATEQNNSIVVSRWVASAWSPSTVDSDGNASTSPSLALDEMSNLYVAWQEQVASAYGIHVRRFDGASWISIGTSASGRGVIEDPYAGIVGAPRLRVRNRIACVGWNGNGQIYSLRCARL